MTITIVTPSTGDPFGPGFQVTVATDLIGPLEADSFWRIVLTSPANENILASFTRPYVSPLVIDTFRNGTPASSSIVSPLSDVHEGDSARLRVELVEPTFGVADTADQTVVVDRNTGQAAQLAYWIAGRLDAQPVGLTTDQGEQLARVEAGMAVGLGVLPVDLIGGLADALINGPGLGVGSLSSAYELTGDGEMPDIGTTFRTRLGIFFIATVIPAGLGHRHGQSEEYPSRLVQWRTVHAVGGTEMVTEVIDFTTHGEIWRWREAKPLRIEYSVLPGVTISARWHWWP